jgi:hypothetical protein
MTNDFRNRRHTPVLDIDVEEITTRIKALTRIEVCERCEPLVTATVFDGASAVMGIGRLYLRMLAERRRAADFEAAIRAALGAERDGDSDPLGFLRDAYEANPENPFAGWGGADG